MPDENGVPDLLSNTLRECRRNLRLFQEQQLPRLTSTSSAVIKAPGEWYTQNISNPVFEHFKHNAPHYLERIKAEHRPDDGWMLWAKKGLYNGSVDVVARYAHLAVSPLQQAMSDIRRKILRETFDSLDPANLLILSANYPLVQRYFAQRVDQLTTPFQYYQDFRGTFQKSIVGGQGAFANLRAHLGQLEGGPMAKTTQLSRVVVDMAEQSIAGKIGVALAVFSLYQIPSVKARTNTSFNQLFPRNTMWGMFGRSIPVRFMFSKPLARIHGSPVLSFAVVSYMMAMSVARTVKDSLELQREYPEIHERLGTYNRDVVNASGHFNFRKTLESIKKWD